MNTLEEYYKVPQNSMWKWQMQLGIEEDEILPWLSRVTLDRVTLNPGGVTRSMWKFLVCKGQQMTETVWLTAARAWSMPVSRISAEATARRGLTERLSEGCQVRPCNSTGWQEDGFLAKIASPLEIVPPGYPMVRRPREENFRQLDVVIGTRDWDAVERFLRETGSKGIARQTENRKQHVRIVLQNGERWYLNLLMSETAQQSRITSEAAAKLGQGNKHEGCMHLRDVNMREVPISVDMVNTTKELVYGEFLPPAELKPHMVLTPENERRIQGMMLTG